MSTKVAELTVDVNVETDKASNNLRSFDQKVKASSDNADTHTSKIGGVFSRLTSPIGSATSAVGGLVTGLGKIGFAAAGFGILAGGAAAASGALVSGNAQFETYNVQFSTLIRNSDDFKAKYKNVTDPLERQKLAAQEATDTMARLAQFGATTPFDLPGVVEADRTLMGFGLQADNTTQRFGFNKDQILALTGDLAAGTGTDFTEMATVLGKFSSGATGDAISRLQELGVTTRTQLTDMGLQFDKGGALIVKNQQDMDKATGILMNAIKTKYGGLMDAQSATFDGMMSNFGDWVNGTIREATKPLFEPIKNSLKGLLDFLNKNNDAIVAGLQKVVGTIASLVGSGLGFAISHMQQIFDMARDSVLTFISAFNGDWKDASTIEPLHRVIGNVATVLGELWDKFQPVISAAWALHEAFNPLAVAFNFIMDLMNGGLNVALDGLGERVQAVGDIFGVDLTEPINTVIDFIENVAVPAIQSFAQVFMTDILPAVIEFGQQFLAVAIPALQSFGDFITGTLLPILGQIGSWIVANVLPAFGQIGSFITGTVLPALQSFGEWLGTNLAPLFNTIVSTITGTVLPAFSQFGDFVSTTVVPKLQQIGEFISTDVMPFLQKMAETFISAVNMIVPVLGQLVDFILNTIVPALTTWWSILATILKPAFDALVAFITGAVLPAFLSIVSFITGTLVPAFISIGQFINSNVLPIIQNLVNFLQGPLSTAFNAVSTVVTTVWNTASSVIGTAWGIISGIFDAIVSFISGTLIPAWNNYVEGVQTAWNEIVSAIQTAWNTVSGIFNEVIAFIGGALATAWNGITTTVQGVWNAVTGAINTGVQSVKDALNSIITFIGTLPSQALALAGQIGQAIIDGVVSAVNAGAKTITDAIGNVVTAPVDFVKGLLGIHSPSTVFFDIGKNITAGLINGIGDDAKGVFNTLGTILNGIKLDALKEAGEAADILTKVSASVGAIADNLNKLIGYVSVGQGFIDAFKADTINIIQQFLSIANEFSDKMQKAVAGISDTISKVASAMQIITTLQSLTKYSAIGKDIIFAFGQDIFSLIANVYNISKYFDAGMQALAVQFGDTITKSTAGLSQALTILTGLVDYVAIGSDAIDSFGKDVFSLVANVYNISKYFDDNMKRVAADFGATIGNAVSGLANALAVLQDLAKYTPIGKDAINLFGQDIFALVANVYNVSKYFSEEMQEAVIAFGETIGKAVAGLDDALKILQALPTYVVVGSNAITLFGRDLQNLIGLMVSLAQNFSVDGIKAAATFGEAIGKILGGLSNALSLFKSLSGENYVGVAVDSVNAFGNDLHNMIQLLVTIAGQFDKDLVAAAATFGEAVGKLFNGIKPAFELFSGLMQYSSVPSSVMDAFIADVRIAVQKASDMANTMSKDMLEKVALFGDATGKIFNGFKSAMDVFEGLQEFKGIPAQVMQYFVDNIIMAVNIAADMANKTDVDLLGKAQTFAEAVDKIFSKFKSAMDVFTSLNDIKDVPTSVINKILDAIGNTIGRMAALNDKANLILAGAESFADTMAKAWQKVQEGLSNQANINNSGANLNSTPTSGGNEPSATTLSLPAFASGGIFSGARPIIVGDSAAPEAVIPIDMLRGYISDAIKSTNNTNSTQRFEIALSIDSNDTSISDERMLQLLETALETVSTNQGQNIISKRSIFR